MLLISMARLTFGSSAEVMSSLYARHVSRTMMNHTSRSFATSLSRSIAITPPSQLSYRHVMFSRHGGAATAVFSRRGMATSLNDDVLTTTATTIATDSGNTALDTLAINAATMPSLGENVEWKFGMLKELGLCNNTPVGFVQMLIECFHVTGLPWWAAIMTSTVALRVLIFPLVIKALTNSARMSDIKDDMALLSERMNDCKQRNDDRGSQLISMEYKELFRKNNVNPLVSLGSMAAQIPIFFSAFIGIRKMAELPVQDMSTGGALWFPNLLIADPYYILPALSTVTMLAIIELGADGLKAGNDQGHMKWMMRGMGLVSLPVAVYMPSSVLCYWVASNSFSLVQTLLFKVPTVRKTVGLPPIKPITAGTLKMAERSQKKSMGFIEGVRTGFRSTMDSHNAKSEVKKNSKVMESRIKNINQNPLFEKYDALSEAYEREHKAFNESPAFANVDNKRKGDRFH